MMSISPFSSFSKQFDQSQVTYSKVQPDLLHELIAIAATHAILIDEIEGIFERTDTHHLSLCAADGHRQQEPKHP